MPFSAEFVAESQRETLVALFFGTRSEQSPASHEVTLAYSLDVAMTVYVDDISTEKFV
jgi:hypothetical protein